MNDLEFYFDEETYSMIQPYDSSSSANLFDINISDTFSTAGATPVCLPPGLVYVGERQSLVIFERPPCYKAISYNKSRREDAINKKNSNSFVTVGIPWQIYVGEFGPNGILNALHLYFASNEIAALGISALTPHSEIILTLKNNGRLFKAALPNIYESNLVCLDKETYYPENSNLASKINLMYSSVWDTVFNADITYAIDVQIQHLRDNGYSIGMISSSSLESWFKYWKKISLEKIMENLDFAIKNNSANAAMFCACNHVIKLSEFFIQPSTYRFFNSLQQIL